MSTISQSESQWYKELVTPFVPMGRLLIGTDLRGTKCDRFGKGELNLVGYGDSSGGYAFSPANQDAAIGSSSGGSVLSNIANSLPRITEVQDMAGKWIDTITLHALDEFIEQTEPQSFIPNTLRIFSGEQKGFRSDGIGNRNSCNTYTLVAEIPIPALTRANVPRSFTVKVAAYIPPAQNIYLGLAIPQPYTCSFELWDLQANTLVGSGFTKDTFVGEGNDLNEDNPSPSSDFTFVLPIDFAEATWILGSGNGGNGGTGGNPTPPPPSTVVPRTPPVTNEGGDPDLNGNSNIGGGGVSPDKDQDKPEPSSPSDPTPTPGGGTPPPDEGGCVPIQDCTWHRVSVPSNVGKIQVNVGDYTGLCPKGTVSRGIVEFEISGTFVICCGGATYPPNNLGCSSLVKWSCVSGGTCVEDVLGTYNSQTECQAALVPPPFTGGQSVTLYYPIFTVNYSDGRSEVYDFQSQTVYYLTGPLSINAGVTQIGTIPAPFGATSVRVAAWNPGVFFYANGEAVSATVAWFRLDGNFDGGGNLPSQCP